MGRYRPVDRLLVMQADDHVQVRFRRFLLPILLMFVASAAIRWWQRDDRIVANIEASYHVLLTVDAMNQTPPSVHRFLPIVTLGRPLDRDVPFGASVRGPGGVYYYTSFPPLGFIAPWAFFRLTHLAPNVDHLMVFNMGIHLVATLLLALLVMEAANALDVDPHTRAWIVMLSAASYLFTFEALYSHGIVYWHHSLFQVFWLVQLVMAARVFRCAASGVPIRRRDVVVLVACSALGPATEWAGYLATASIAGICWWRARHTAGHPLRRIALALLLAETVSGLVFVAHFAWVLGLSPLLDALRARAGARSTPHGSLVALAFGYVESFGAFLLFAGAVVATYLVVVRRRPPGWIVALLLAAVLPLSENLLLAQHATTYHYDRLKALVPLIGASALLIVMLPSQLRRQALFTWLAVLTWNVDHLKRSRSIATVPSMAINASLLRRVHAIARPCALFATNTYPRGWVELSLAGNAYEAIPSADSVRSLVASRGACQGLYFVVARSPGEAMYVWRRAVVYEPTTGNVDTLDWSAPKRFKQ
ncbi:MAG TPA: hypothetical protein VF785_06895 [Gemmatimonadaceae bacterium]